MGLAPQYKQAELSANAAASAQQLSFGFRCRASKLAIYIGIRHAYQQKWTRSSLTPVPRRFFAYHQSRQTNTTTTVNAPHDAVIIVAP